MNTIELIRSYNHLFIAYSAMFLFMLALLIMMWVKLNSIEKFVMWLVGQKQIEKNTELAEKQKKMRVY